MCMYECLKICTVYVRDREWYMHYIIIAVPVREMRDTKFLRQDEIKMHKCYSDKRAEDSYKE